MIGNKIVECTVCGGSYFSRKNRRGEESGLYPHKHNEKNWSTGETLGVCPGSFKKVEDL